MKIYTSYFANLKNLVGVVPVSIARFNPRYVSAGTCLDMKNLAPYPNMLRMSEGEYRPKFEAILKQQSAQDVMKELEEISASHGDRDVVLLCYEKVGDFCHRHMVADWLSKELGIEVKEWVNPVQQTPKKADAPPDKRSGPGFSQMAMF